MAYFTWVAVDQAGTFKRGVLFGRHESAVIHQLAQQKMTIVSFFNTSVPRINRMVKASFWQQLSLLLEAGVLLPDALSIIHRMINQEYMKLVIGDLSAGLQEGLSLSQLMDYFSVWSSLERTMIAAGEKSGKLGLISASLAAYFTQQEKFIKHIKQALLMPLITLIFFIAVIFFFFLIIVPRFERLFQKIAHHQTMPTLTQWLISISHLFYSVWFWLGMGVMLGAGIWLCKKYIRLFVVKLPLISSMFRFYFLVSWVEIMMVQIKSGIPVPVALEVAAGVSSAAYKMSALNVAHAVAAGSSLVAALEKEAVFNDELLLSMVQVGHSSGCLEKSLSLAYQHYQQQLRDMQTRITTLFQPVMILLLGLLVLVLVVALYAPLFTMSSLIDMA